MARQATLTVREPSIGIIADDRKEGDTVIHDVQMSWYEARTGTGRVRKFAVNGDELVIETTPPTAGINTRQFVKTLI